MAEKWDSDSGDQQTLIPDELPLIPLLSTVVFPGMIVNLQVSRDRNLKVAAGLEVEARAAGRSIGWALVFRLSAAGNGVFLRGHEL